MEKRPFVFVNMIASVDGRAAIDGRSEGLGSGADLQLLLDLRTRADAVLIGTETLRAEGYDRLVRSEERRARRVESGLAADPLAVLLTRSYDVPWDAGLFAAPEQPVLVYAGPDVPDPPSVPAPVELVRLQVPGLTEMLADLHARGVSSLLSEGGPHMHRALWAAGVVDELNLTISPLITGGDELSIVEGPLAAPAELELVSVRQEGSELFLRYGARR